MIKILQVVDQLVYNSGVSAMLMNLYEFMDKKKFMFDFLVFGPVEPGIRRRIIGGGVRLSSAAPCGRENLNHWIRSWMIFWAAMAAI